MDCLAVEGDHFHRVTQSESPNNLPARQSQKPLVEPFIGCLPTSNISAFDEVYIS